MVEKKFKTAAVAPGYSVGHITVQLMLKVTANPRIPAVGIPMGSDGDALALPQESGSSRMIRVHVGGYGQFDIGQLALQFFLNERLDALDIIATAGVEKKQAGSIFYQIDG